MKVNKDTLVKNLSETSFITEFQKDPRDAVNKAVEKAIEHPLDTDKWIYRMVVIVLGASLMIMVIFMCMQLGVAKVEIPDVFISIISAIVGSIGGLLAPSPIKREN